MKLITVPSSIDDSKKLQKLIDSTGNWAVKYEFLPEHEIEINSLLRVFNFTELDGHCCHFNLMENAPLKPFASSIPLIAPKYPTSAEGLYFHDIVFDGRRDTQKYAKTECKSRGKNEWGQGYHNTIMLGALNNVKYSNSTNCSFYNLEFYNSLGDGIRVEGGNGITVKDIKGRYGGHDVVCVAATKNAEVSGVEADLAVNVGVRFRSVTEGTIHDCKLNGGTGIAYSPAIQIQSTAKNWRCSGVTVYNNYIHDTYGPGIWVAGSVPDNDTIIKNNLLLRCGQMPAANKISGVGAIVTDGFDAQIRNNTIVDSYGYGVLVGYYQMKSDITGSVTVNRNIITGTRKSFYPVSSDAGVANLTAGRYTIDCSENCLYDNIRDLYGVTQTDGIYQDPNFMLGYRLHSESPCRKTDYSLGCYQDLVDEEITKLLITCKECDISNIINEIRHHYDIFRGV